MLPLALALALAGCGSVALGPSFNEYSSTFAETQNRQMLLNLARLHDRHPIYFFQLGQITASYTFTSTAGLTHATSPRNPPGPFTVGTQGATLGATLTHNPIFQFVPLSGSNFAQELLTPVSADVFTELYEEGWPVDLLMRTLIERLEFDAKPQAGAAKGKHWILENNPQNGVACNYDRFLVACMLARELQKSGNLRLTSKMEFQPLGGNLVYPKQPDEKTLLDASKSGLTFSRVTEPEAGWQLGRMVRQKTFVINDLEMAGATLSRLKDAPFFGSDKGSEGLALFGAVMTNGFVVRDSAAGDEGASSLLVMRSLMGSMAAMASEQEAWENLKQTDPGFEGLIPANEDYPALQLVWPETSLPDNALASVNYVKQRFTVADPPPASTNVLQSPSWNRDVFFLLIQLSYQVTTNTSSLVAPSVIQIH
jgi:hypothetical protein